MPLAILLSSSSLKVTARFQQSSRHLLDLIINNLLPFLLLLLLLFLLLLRAWPVSFLLKRQTIVLSFPLPAREILYRPPLDSFWSWRSNRLFALSLLCLPFLFFFSLLPLLILLLLPSFLPSSPASPASSPRLFDPVTVCPTGSSLSNSPSLLSRSWRRDRRAAASFALCKSSFPPSFEEDSRDDAGGGKIRLLLSLLLLFLLRLLLSSRKHRSYSSRRFQVSTESVFAACNCFSVAFSPTTTTFSYSYCCCCCCSSSCIVTRRFSFRLQS